MTPYPVLMTVLASQPTGHRVPLCFPSWAVSTAHPDSVCRVNNHDLPGQGTKPYPPCSTPHLDCI